MTNTNTKAPIPFVLDESDVEIILSTLAAACEMFVGDTAADFPVTHAADIGLKLSAGLITQRFPILTGADLTLIEVVLSAATDTMHGVARDESVPQDVRRAMSEGALDVGVVRDKITATLAPCRAAQAKADAAKVGTTSPTVH